MRSLWAVVGGGAGGALLGLAAVAGLAVAVLAGPDLPVFSVDTFGRLLVRLCVLVGGLGKRVARVGVVLRVDARGRGVAGLHRGLRLLSCVHHP